MQTEILNTPELHSSRMSELDKNAGEIIDHVGMYVQGKWVAFDTYHLMNDTTSFIIRICEVEDDISTNTNLNIGMDTWANVVEPIIVITTEAKPSKEDYRKVAAHAWQTYIDKCTNFAGVVWIS